MNSLNNEQLEFLSIYNFINKDANLVELAEELQSQMENETINFEITTKLNKISSEIYKNLTFSKLLHNENLLPVKKTRVFMDGVFDIIHSGHFNALRQGRKLGDILVLGVNSDEDVEKAKGPPLMNVHERAALVGACKWVDEVVISTPYTPTLELLDQLNIDFCVHGDDPCFNENGEDVYGPMKKAGRFKMFKRTEGISTTEIIGRLLLLNTERKQSFEGDVMTTSTMIQKGRDQEFSKGPVVSSFLTTGRRLHEFCNNKIPKENDKVIYVDGAWDILHVGHIEILKKAKELGNFLYVGVHDDLTINENRGKNYPILNLQERVFNLLALKYVDDVVVGAPWKITEDLIKTLKISIVARGVHPKYDEEYTIKSELDDPYAIARRMNILQEINHEYDMDSEILVKRVVEKRDHYLKKYQKKSNSEKGYYEIKEYLQEI